MWKFKSANIPPELDISTIMSTAQGVESRFGNRFIKFAGTSEKFTQSADLTGNAINSMRESAAMITEQKKGVDRIFLMAERAINSISNLEKDSGKNQVKNLPIPSDAIRASYGKKMGYSALTMEFLTDCALFFMEEVINLEEALTSRDNTISKLAASIPDQEIIGAFEEIDLNELSSVPQVDTSTYAKPEKQGGAAKKIKK
jgi:hypothetical protein